MKGTRPLDNDEIRSVSTCFTGTFATRNRGLFLLGASVNETEIIKRYIQKFIPYKHWFYSTFNAVRKGEFVNFTTKYNV